MSNPKHITVPISPEEACRLQVGDKVLLSGQVLAARDAAHKRLVECLDRGEQLPIDLTNQVIYYVGPSPAKPGRAIGAAGPTTSGRMDAYTPRLLELGLGALVGKGYRSKAVIDAIVKTKTPYLATVGGAGALISRCIKADHVVAWPELGPEALALMDIENLPAIVVIDVHGNNYYEQGQAPYCTLTQE